MHPDYIVIELDYDDMNVLKKDRGIFLKAHINDGEATIAVTLKFATQKDCCDKKENNG